MEHAYTPNDIHYPTCKFFNVIEYPYHRGYLTSSDPGNTSVHDYWYHYAMGDSKQESDVLLSAAHGDMLMESVSDTAFMYKYKTSLC